MGKNPPRLILITGDPSIVCNKLLETKALLFPEGATPGQWIVFEIGAGKIKTFMKTGLNSLEAEVSTPDWEEQLKVVVLRGMADNKAFRTSICDIVLNVAPTNCFIILDESGTIYKTKKKNEWADFKKICKKMGEIIDVGKSLSDLKEKDQIDYVIKEAGDRGKTISRSAASDLLSIVSANRAVIISELDRISDLVKEPAITAAHVKSMAFPMSGDYQIWKFYNAFDSGSYEQIMEATDQMLKSNIAIEPIVDIAMKRVRWHLIAADLYTYRKDIASGLVKFGGRDVSQLSEKVRAMPCLPPRLFKTGKALERALEHQKTHPKTDSIKSEYEARRIVDLVVSRMLPSVVSSRPKDQKLAMKTLAMNRYLAMFEVVEGLRDPNKNSVLAFKNAVRKISWRTK
jgi:hypothetical protein